MTIDCRPGAMTGRALLLAEDSEDDRFLFAEAAAAAKIDAPVQMVENGQQVLDYVQGKGGFADRRRFPCPALVLLDIKMPVKNGFETLEALRADPLCRTLPVVILSASTQPEDIELAYRLGANAYLGKPSALAELVDMLGCVCAFWLRYNRRPE